MKIILKTVSLILATVFLMSILVACGGNPDVTTPKDTTSSTTPPEDEIQDSVPKDLNYNGETITFFSRDNMEIFKYEVCSDTLMKDTLYDAVHYRNIDVENRLGVKITQYQQPSAWGDQAKAWFETLSTAVNTNSSDYDAAAMYSCYGSSYALQNLYYNLNDVSVQYGDGYLDLEKPWWNQSVVNDLTMYGALYFLSGDLATSATYGTHLLWFNKDLFNEKFPDEGGHKVLYNMVDNQTWTIDKMADYVSKIWDDVNTSGNIDDGDTVGFKYFRTKEVAQMDSWTWALGVNVFDKDAYGEISLANFAPRVTAAFDILEGMYHGEGAMISDGTRDTDATSLQAGNVLFQVGGIGDGEVYRGTTVNYGALPMPKYNEEQEDYGNGMWSYSTFYVILNNLSEDRAKMVSAVLEVMAAESYKSVTPAYYEKVVTGVYAKEEEDSRMLDIAIRTCKYTFEQVYSTSLGTALTRFFRNLDADPQTTIDSHYNTTWPTALAELLVGLEAIA